MNAASEIPQSAGLSDPRFKPGNIIVSYRHLNTLVIIDRDTSKIVWKLDGITIGQHNSHILPAGVPGTGHILVFDNGLTETNYNPGPARARPRSRVLEINPLDSSIVYEYDARKSGHQEWTFFSHHISGAERQPNGNTLICEGANGRFFEVTPAGEIVWEYVHPFPGREGQLLDNTVFRVSKVPESWLRAAP